MSKRQTNLHPTLFDPAPKQPQWQDLPQRIRHQLLPLLVQLLNSHAVRNSACAKKGGADE
jgi:hypothetical protein